MQSAIYIEKSLSLSKDGYENPWRFEYLHPYDAQRKVVVYFENQWNESGSTYKDKPVYGVGEELGYILEQLLPRIEKYPYYWEMENQKINPIGYDFYTDQAVEGQSNGMIEIVDASKVILWEKLRISPRVGQLIEPITHLEEVEGQFLVKFQLTLEKSGPVNEIDLNLHTIKPVELASLVYEEDTGRYVVPKEINITGLEIKSSTEGMQIRLPEPIYAKRFTFVLRQNEPTINKYNVPRAYSDKKYTADAWQQLIANQAKSKKGYYQMLANGEFSNTVEGKATFDPSQLLTVKNGIVSINQNLKKFFDVNPNVLRAAENYRVQYEQWLKLTKEDLLRQQLYQKEYAVWQTQENMRKAQVTSWTAARDQAYTKWLTKKKQYDLYLAEKKKSETALKEWQRKYGKKG